MHVVEAEKVYVNPDGTAVVNCPECGTTKIIRVDRFKGSKRRVQIRCKCQSAFRISFEFRKAYRRESRLRGHYAKVAAPEQRGKMKIKDISLTGIGFTTEDMHNLRKGDEVKVRFTLDDRTRSRIEKQAVVRWINDKHIGCQFTEPSPYDKVLGFYLMS